MKTFNQFLEAMKYKTPNEFAKELLGSRESAWLPIRDGRLLRKLVGIEKNKNVSDNDILFFGNYTLNVCSPINGKCELTRKK